MAIDKYAVLVRKNTILSGGLIDNKTLNTDGEEIIAFNNMSLQVGTADPENVIIPSLEEVVRINAEIAETNFDIQYTLEYLAKDSSFANPLPSAAELNDLYNNAGIAVKTFSGEDKTLKRYPDSTVPTELNLKNGEGISVVETGTGLFEVAGYQADKILISELKNQLPSQIADLEQEVDDNKVLITGLDSRVFANEGSIATLEATSSSKDTEIAGIKTATESNSQGIISNGVRITTNAGDITTNSGAISVNQRGIQENKEQINADVNSFQPKKISNTDTNFPGIDTVETRIEDAGKRIKILEGSSSAGEISQNTADIVILKKDKQPITAVNRGDFGATTMEGRDEEVRKIANDAAIAAAEAKSKVDAFESSGDLATYILEATAAQALPVGSDETITFSGIQTNFGNDDGAGGVKVDSNLSNGQIIIHNDIYTDKRWIIASHLVVRKTNNAGNPNATITLKVKTADKPGELKYSKPFPISGLDNDNDMHSLNISNIIIDGTDALYHGKKIIVYLDASVTGTGVTINQGRNFGVEEKPGGIVSVVATTDALFAVDSATEGGTTQKEINESNFKSSLDTSKVKIDTNGQTSIDGINITGLNERLSGYVKEADDLASIDGYKITDTFDKLLNVEVSQPDNKGNIKLGDLITTGGLALTSLDNNQSLIDRDDVKLKQLYVKDGETEVAYKNRLFEEVNEREAFVDGFNSDFNINWVQSKVDWRPANDPLGQQEGKQIWNSIRINNNLTVDLLQKELIKPIAFDAVSNPCVLINTSTLTQYNSETTLTGIVNEITKKLSNLDNNISELNRLKFDAGTHKYDLAEEGTPEAGSLGAGSIVLTQAEYDAIGLT